MLRISWQILVNLVCQGSDCDTMPAPSSNVSLLSVSQFDNTGCQIKFVNGHCTISDSEMDKVILTGTMRKNLYYLNNASPKAVEQFVTKVYHTTNAMITLDPMHQHLGHLNILSVKQLFKRDMIRGITLSDKSLKETPSICKCCI